MGINYIDNYKPHFNYQHSLLPYAVNKYLKNNPEMNNSLGEAGEQFVINF